MGFCAELETIKDCRGSSPLMQSESTIQADIITYLESRGYIVIRLNAGEAISPYTGNHMKIAPAGSTDLLVVAPDRIDFIEVKREGWNGKLSDTQEDMHGLLKLYGYTPHVVNSLDQVEAIYKDTPDGDREMMMQVVYRPRVRGKGYLGEYQAFEEWESEIA